MTTGKPMDVTESRYNVTCKECGTEYEGPGACPECGYIFHH